jgi:hypothetical protein
MSDERKGRRMGRDGGKAWLDETSKETAVLEVQDRRAEAVMVDDDETIDERRRGRAKEREELNTTSA